MTQRMLGFIPARGGSKGIKNKNVALLGGKPLIQYTLEAAKKVRELSVLHVSTDDPSIAEVCRTLGQEVPFLRPTELAQDLSLTIDAVLYTLDRLKRDHALEFDSVCLLQPTSPLRLAEDIQSCIRTYYENEPCSVVSLTALDEPHPYKLKIIYDGRVYPFMPGMESGVPRQSLPKLHHLNGAVYIASVETLRTRRSFFHELRTLPYLMPEERSTNINSPTDFKLAEIFLRQ